MSAQFTEHFVDADGFHIRYLEAGQGEPLISLHGGGGLMISEAHELLAEHHRVIAFEAPGFGQSPANERSSSMAELALTISDAISALGIEQFDLWGASFGGLLACWLAVQRPERVKALVLEAPAAIRLGQGRPPAGGPRAMAEIMFAHPERHEAMPAPDPAVAEKQRALAARVMGPPRDPELERRLGELPVPTMVLIGTKDRLIPPETGRVYKELMPNCQFVLVYDAAHHLEGDRPEAFVNFVHDFLTRHEQFIVTRDSSLIHP